MKIGLFTDTYYPQINGVAISVQMLKEALELLGHQVYVFTTTDPNAPKKEIHVYRLPSIPFVEAKRFGMLYHPHLARFIRKLGLDLIHTQTEFPLGIFGRRMARELQIPLLHTYHTIYEDYTHYLVKFGSLDSIAKTMVRKLSANFCNSADEVIVPTEKVKELLLSYGVNQDISVIPTGIKLDKFYKCSYSADKVRELRTNLGIGMSDKVILYIGRMSEEKNISEILIAMKSYLKDRNDVKFLLIGDGSDRHNLEYMAKELNIHKQVIFAGERPWNEIGIYYQLGDIFVSASQSETQGLTYIEALASGLPVVAKADRCLDGVVKNNVNGYAFHDQEDFLQALDSILYNDIFKEQLSIGAIKEAERFSVKSFADTVESLYQHTFDSREVAARRQKSKHNLGHFLR